MRNTLRTILLAAAGATIVGAAVAQTIFVPTIQASSSGDLVQILPNGQPGPSNTYIGRGAMAGWILGSDLAHNAAPTLTTSAAVCGGSSGSAISGTDFAGVITTGGSAATSCVITFAKAFTKAPACTGAINNVADTAFKLNATTTGITFTQSSATSNVINYVCVGAPN